jgi:hypothetical protein
MGRSRQKAQDFVAVREEQVAYVHTSDDGVVVSFVN